MSDLSAHTLPVSTQWALTKSLPADEMPIKNVFLIYCPKTQSKGTGFLLSNGRIISNEHVVQGCTSTEILAISSSGETYKIKNSIVDKKRDLVILTPEKTLDGGLKLDLSIPHTRQAVHTWGFPLLYNGPSPLLATGYISGFAETPEKIKRLVINGSFNAGNSGGPLFGSDDKVIGIVVAKWVIPLTPFQSSALQALQKNSSGFQYNTTDLQGNKISVSEAQLIANLLEHYWKHSQVTMGEAIFSTELAHFLKENGIELT